MTYTSNPLNARRRPLLGLASVVLAAGLFVPAVPASAGERCAGCGDGPERVAARQQPSGDNNDSPGRRRNGDDKKSRDKGEGDERRGRDGRYGYGSPFELGWGGDGRQGDLRQPRPQEWAETQAFMYLHSPRRQQAIDQLPEGGKKESIKKFLFARYRTFQSLQRRDRGAFEQRLAQLRVEDQIFGLVSDWGLADEDQRQKLKERLRAETATLIDLDLRERQRRVDDLRRELDEETRALEADLKDRDALVEKRLGRFVDWASRWAARKGKQADAEKQPPAGEAPGTAPVDPGGHKQDKRD